MIRAILLSAVMILTWTAGFHASESEDISKSEVEVKTDAQAIDVSDTDRAFGAFQRGLYLTAFELALPQAQNGDAAAQTLIAELYERGLGIARDPKSAADWYKIAANSGNREAQFAYAVKLLKGEVIEQNTELGLEMMKKAADAGHPVALYNYANHLIDQRPTSATYRKVLPLYEKAAEFRLADAYYALAKIYDEGLANGISDPEKGNEWLKKAARAGIDTAQVELGIKLLVHNHDEEKASEAYKWLRAAASSGNIIAQNRLAHMYFSGIGVEASHIEGAKWYLLSRRAGRADISLDLRLQSMSEKDQKEATELANRWQSANAGNAAFSGQF